MFSWFKKLFEKDETMVDEPKAVLYGKECHVIIRRSNNNNNFEERLIKASWGYGGFKTHVETDSFEWFGRAETLDEAVFLARKEWNTIKDIMSGKTKDVEPIYIERLKRANQKQIVTFCNCPNCDTRLKKQNVKKQTCCNCGSEFLN